MFNLDPGKLLVILVVGLIVLGPERLPRVARQAGMIWRELHRYRDQFRDEVHSALPDLPRITRPSTMISSLFAEAPTTSTPASSNRAAADPTPRLAPSPSETAEIGAIASPAPDDPSMN